MIRPAAVLSFSILLAAANAAKYPPPNEGDFVAHNFKFTSGETMPELRLHYRTLGKAVRDANGVTQNAVVIMHGTTGSGAQFIRPEFADDRLGLLRLALHALFKRLRKAEDFIALASTEILVETRRRNVRVSTDGEVTMMNTPLQYRVRPGALSVLVPEEAVAK